MKYLSVNQATFSNPAQDEAAELAMWDWSQ